MHEDNGLAMGDGVFFSFKVLVSFGGSAGTQITTARQHHNHTNNIVTFSHTATSLCQLLIFKPPYAGSNICHWLLQLAFAMMVR